MTETVEQEITRKGLNAPRVTPDDIEFSIITESYFTAADGVMGAIEHPEGRAVNKWPPYESLGCLTFCVLVLRNGFTVTGESACASPANFDAAIGRRIARENAARKIWPLLGYALRSAIANDKVGV